MMNLFKKQRIYLDHAATTFLDKDVFKAMEQVFLHYYANPSAWHREGVSAHQRVIDARKRVATQLGTTSDHIIFTRGGTESCNLALKGAIDQARRHMKFRPHVITSNSEHPAVREVLAFYAQAELIDLSIIPIKADGLIDSDLLKKELRAETILVSVMYVNNEIGTVQPIGEIAKLLRWFKKQEARRNNTERSMYPLLHTDAIQAAAYQDLHVDRLGVDLMSLSGSKIYGPKSSGVCYVRDHALMAPQFFGGEQEMGLRAGTEDVASLVGFATALEKVRTRTERESQRLAGLRDAFSDALLERIPDMVINHTTSGSPHIAHITVPGISGERLVIELDAQGIAASSRAACSQTSHDDTGSPVMRALRTAQGAPFIPDDGDLRFSLGKDTTSRELMRTAKVLGEIVQKIRFFESRLTSWGNHVR